jgi:hypothetical protein
MEEDVIQVINLGEWFEGENDTVFLYMDAQWNFYCTSLYDDGIDARNIRNGRRLFLRTVCAFELSKQERAQILRRIWEKWEEERKDYPPFEG